MNFERFWKEFFRKFSKNKDITIIIIVTLKS